MKIFTPSLNPSHQGREKLFPFCGRGQAKGLYADEFYFSHQKLNYYEK